MEQLNSLEPVVRGWVFPKYFFYLRMVVARLEMPEDVDDFQTARLPKRFNLMDWLARLGWG